MGLKYSFDFDLDDPRTTLAHRDIILQKRFLKNIYIDWYHIFKKEIAIFPEGKILEIGSGGGFVKEILPTVITSDIMPLPHCDMCFSAHKLPFEEGELSAILMINVFHHIPKPYLFLAEAQRCLKKGGMIIMIEPSNSWLGRIIYPNFHHEPFEPTGGWEIEDKGPLSFSNQAMPWIYVERDRELFQQKFDKLDVLDTSYHTPMRYILSGGVSRKALLPDVAYPLAKLADQMLSGIWKGFSLFFTTRIVKK